jgi:Kef-type K+ transport system membrane component KefB
VDLFLLLGAGVLAGEIASRLGQAALVGQLLVGVLLGPTLLSHYFNRWLGLASLSPELAAIQFLATVFILFMAGLDVSPEQIYRMGLPTLLLGIAVFAIPFATISLVAFLVLPIHTGLLPVFLGLTLSITALPVMGILLIEFGLLKSRLGNLLINTALVNELAAVSTFAVLLEIYHGGASTGLAIAIAVLSVGVFLGVVLTIHMALRALRATTWWASSASRFFSRWRTREAAFAVLMVGVVGASLFSQFMGLTFVVGAFYAGILVTQETAGAETHRAVSQIVDAMTWGFFIPLFFAFVGVQMNFWVLASPVFVYVFLVLVAVAISSKLFTGYSVARFFGWPPSDALAIGHLVSSRGAVELAMAVILLTDGVFTTQTFTLVAGVGLVTTIIAPIGAKYVWSHRATESAAILGRVQQLIGNRPEGESPFPVTLSFGILEDRPSDLRPDDVRPAPPAEPPPRGPGPSAAPPPPPPLPRARSAAARPELDEAPP